MQYFLVKTDPDTFSVYDFEKEGETLWDGVHSNAAINFIKQMQPGDMVYVYHSMADKAILALAKVTGVPYLNTADPRHSWAVTLQFIKHLPHPITLATIKATPELADFALVKQSRLSVMPTPEHILTWLEQQSL